MVDELFSKRLPITVKSVDREERKVPIQVTVEIHTTAGPGNRKKLVIRLTDEKDLFFLYTLHINEEDFQSLKTQQGLLVDFGAFPQRFIDLLNHVLQEEHKDLPKFILDLVCSGSSGLGVSPATLNVIETNPFKHLTHLALKFCPGSDVDVKKYLASCLKALKDTNETLLHKLEHTESHLSTELRQAREALAMRTSELDALKRDWSLQQDDLSNKHFQTVNMEREKNLQAQQSAQQKFEKEKRDMELSQQIIVRQMESKLQELDVANKDLTDKKYRSDSLIRELKARLSTVEEENNRNKHELSQLRQSNSELDCEHHEQEKTLNQMKISLAVTEQEVRDKEQLIHKTTELLATEKEQKKRTEEDLSRKQRQVGKLEVSIKTMSEELIKGNEIIKKLQGEIRNYHAKLKLRNQVTTEQEKLLGEKNKEMEEIRKDLEAVKSKLTDKEAEVEKLNSSLEKTVEKLEESKQLLKTNENVINWLNKQVTELQLNPSQRQIGSSGPFEINSHRQHHILSNTSNGSGGYGTTRSHPIGSGGLPHSTPLGHGSVPPPSSAGLGSGIAITSRSHDNTQPHQLHQPQAYYHPTRGSSASSGIPRPVAKSSPLDNNHAAASTAVTSGATRNGHPVDAHASPAHLEAKAKRESAALDAKYFQRSADPPLVPSTNTASLHFESAVGPGAPQGTRSNANLHSPTAGAGLAHPPSSQPSQPSSVRLPKEGIVPTSVPPQPPLTRPTPTHGTAGRAQPPLASSYFPAPGRVT